MTYYTIGVDLGGTTITAGLVNEESSIVYKKTCATNLPRPAQEARAPGEEESRRRGGAEEAGQVVPAPRPRRGGDGLVRRDRCRGRMRADETYRGGSL